MLTVFSLGLCCSVLQLHNLSNDKLPAAWVQKPVVLCGRIISLPKQDRLGTHFLFETQHRVFSVVWYHNQYTMHYGESWRLALKLKPPHGLHNPGGFDYERWLFMQGIKGTGYIVESLQTPRLLKTASFSFGRYREKLQHNILEACPMPLAAVLIALTIGTTQNFTDQIWEVFNHTGTTHLMAVSGSHVGLVVAWSFFLVTSVWKCSSRLVKWLPAATAASIVSSCGAFCYSFLVGNSIPTQRAIVMLLIFFLASVRHSGVKVGSQMGVAVVLLSALHPLILFYPGFWLSFAAVGWIIYSSLGRDKARSRIYNFLKLQWTVCLGLFPLLLYFFHKIPSVAWLANVVAIPWIEFLVMPCCLLALLLNSLCVSWGNMAFVMCGNLLKPLWFFLTWLQYSPVFYQNVSLGLCVVLIILAAVLTAPMGLSGRWLACLGLFPVLWPKISMPLSKEAWVMIFDVGQGLAVLIQTQHHVLLYDVGDHTLGGFDAGRDVLVPYLKGQGVKNIDRIVISHGDSDHSGGLWGVFGAFLPTSILTSAPKAVLKRVPEGVGVRVRSCYAGQNWHWDGIDFAVLAPERGSLSNTNNSSCVLKMRVGHFSMLFPGDIEKPREKWLLQHAREGLQDTTLLIAPHHGSRTSSSTEFLSVVNPKHAFFSVGYYNRYHLPNPNIMRRYIKNGTYVWSTSQQGAILIRLRQQGVSIQPTKVNHFWHSP